MLRVRNILLALVFACIPVVCSAQYTVFNFTAEWCGPCQIQHKAVDQVQKEGFDVRYVNVDKYKELTQQLRVQFIPCSVAVIYKDGGYYEVGRIQGVATEGQLRRLSIAPVATTYGAWARQSIRSVVCPTVLFLEP